jgi:hypothetical protein
MKELSRLVYRAGRLVIGAARRVWNLTRRRLRWR